MKKICVVLAMFAICCVAKAVEWTPLQIGLWPSDWQVSPEELRVSGLKFNLPFGGNDVIGGLDLGFASTSQDCSGLQLNLIVNRVHCNFSGIHFALLNQTENTNGLEIGLMNIAANRLKGIQVGLVNSAMDVRGIQVGVLNYTEFMSGVQIGLFNFITKSRLPFFPLVNFCF